MSCIHTDPAVEKLHCYVDWGNPPTRPRNSRPPASLPHASVSIRIEKSGRCIRIGKSGRAEADYLGGRRPSVEIKNRVSRRFATPEVRMISEEDWFIHGRAHGRIRIRKQTQRNAMQNATIYVSPPTKRGGFGGDTNSSYSLNSLIQPLLLYDYHVFRSISVVSF